MIHKTKDITYVYEQSLIFFSTFNLITGHAIRSCAPITGSEALDEGGSLEDVAIEARDRQLYAFTRG